MDLPIAVVAPKGAHRLRRGTPWCYRTELAEAPRVDEAGAIVRVVDGQHNPIGQAFWARTSPIALRMLTRDGRGTEPERIDDAFFRRRLEAALARRAVYAGRDAMRLVHGEADLLPGLFVDRYGDGLTIQTLSEGMDARKERLARMLVELTGAKAVVVRDDGSGRDFEGLKREVRPLLGEAPFRFQFHEGENLLEVDLVEDMKTGSFLDQLDNHLRAGELARGQALDLFSYHGGFALALARRADHVIAVEQDTQAAERARANALRNGRKNLVVENANAFDRLREFATKGRRFDTIVVDPPGLAKRKEGLETALRAYHELNLRAFKCLAPEGVLITCSCSGKVTRERFEQMVISAGQDARRTVQILERRGAGLDHPVLSTQPETEYLKVWIVRAAG